ncbi:MAG: MATE family efflux transporter [Lachnospiraceae bacterium]|nr:MATE family efflux transporter [Lachnospiraceae bacterium]
MKKLIGTREFYRHLFAVVVPIMIQNGITNFVGMLDNIMVGQIGTAQMSGVSIVNQLIFVFNLCIFGGVAGAGIFTAQFYGQGNNEGVRHTFRIKIIIIALISIIGMLVFTLLGDNLIMLYLKQEGQEAGIQMTLSYARIYLAIMLIDLIPFAISQTYAGTLRECNETFLPMVAGITAVLVNLVFNYILIYGKFGAPALGVAGAAIATVISRIVEMLIILIYTHSHAKKHPFIQGAYRHFFDIPSPLVKDVVIKGTPLLFNEFLWSSGMAVLSQNYAIRGLEVIAAFNISSTISNVFNIVFISMGSAIAIIIGQELGAGREDVRDEASRLTFFAVMACVVTGLLMLLMAPAFPNIYNTEDTVKELATSFIVVAALCMPMYSYENATYFIIRSGGKTLITFLFDSCFIWVCAIPLAFTLTHFTQMPIVPIYVCCQLIELIKCAIGFFLVHKGIWINDLTRVANS